MPFAPQSQAQLAGRAWRRAHLRSQRLPRPYAPRLPIGIEREYFRDIRGMLTVIREAVIANVIPMIPALINKRKEFRPDSEHADSGADDVKRLLERVAIITEESYSEDDIKAIALRRGEETAKWNSKNLSRNVFKVVNVNPIFSDAYLRNELSLFAVTNVNLITSLKDDALAKLQTSILVDLQQGTRAEDMAANLLDQIDPEVGNVAARANLIARDQISKLNGQLNQLRQQDIGIERYRWRTVGDHRVREEHALLNGEIFSWDDPPEPGHPGEDYQCRCTAEPVFEDVIPGLEAPEI